MTDKSTDESVSDEIVFTEDDLVDQVDETVEEQPDEQPVEGEVETVEETVEEAIEALQAPDFWKDDHKSVFQKLQELDGGRDMAQSWLDNYNEGQKYITQKSQEFADQRRAYESDLNEHGQYQQIIQQIAPKWQAEGVHPLQGLGRLIAAEQALDNDFIGTVQQLAQARGIDLQQAVNDQPYMDPDVSNELGTLRQKIDQMSQYILNQEQGAQHQNYNANVQAIEEFKNLTDGKGNKLHPYYDKVEQDMIAAVKFGKANDVQSAYDYAVRINADIQSEIAEKAKLAEAAKRQADVQKAKEASNTTSSNSKAAPKESLTFEEELLAGDWSGIDD